MEPPRVLTCMETHIRPVTKALSLAESVLMISEAVKQLRAAQPERLVVVGISGPTGAGKTTLARKVCSMFNGSRVISMRNYFRKSAGKRRRGCSQIYCDRNSNPASFDIALLCQHLAALQRNESVEAPSWEFQGGQYGRETLAPPPSGLLIVEGVCALDMALRSLYSLSVFVLGGLYFDLLRRVQSDIGDDRFDASDVFPGMKSFVEASWKHAQFRVRNEVDSSVAKPENQLYMLKVPLPSRSAAPTAEEIARKLDSEAWTVQDMTYVDWFMVAPSDDSSGSSADLKCRLLGGKCFITPERYWAVEHPFIISPESGEFEVETATVAALKRIGYRIVISYKQHTVIFSDSVRGVSVCVDDVDNEVGAFLRIKAHSKVALKQAAEDLGLWDVAAFETRSYAQLCLLASGPRASTPAGETLNSSLENSQLSESSRAISVLELLGLSDLLSGGTADGGDEEDEDGDGDTADAALAVHIDDGNDVQSDEEKREARQETQALMTTSPDGASGMNDADSSLVPLSFEKGLFSAIRKIQKLKAAQSEQDSTPIIILIGGPVGSGKSSLAARLAEVFTPPAETHELPKGSADRTQIAASQPCDLRLESFIDPARLHQGGEQGSDSMSVDEDDLRAIDLELLRATLQSARKDGSLPAALPVYNYRTRSRTFVHNKSVRPSKIILLTGPHCLRKEIVGCCEGLQVVRVGMDGGQQTHLVSRVRQELEVAGVDPSRRDEETIRDLILPSNHRSISATLSSADVFIRNDFDEFSPILDNTSLYTLKSTSTVSAEIVKARLFAEATIDAACTQGERDSHRDQQDVDSAVEHWQETSLDIYLSPPGRHIQPGSPSAVRIRQFNGKFRMMLRDYIDEGNFIICPQAELRVSLRVLRGLLRAGFTVAGLLEIHSEVLRHKTNGLTVSIDTLPQLGVRMMQMMHCDKAAVGRAAELLHCSEHSLVREGYDSYMMSNWKPGIHTAARTSWASSGAGQALNQLLSDALAPHFAKIQRVERGCRRPIPVQQDQRSPNADNNAVLDTKQAPAMRDDSRTAATNGAGEPGFKDAASGSKASTEVDQQLLTMEQELKQANERTKRARVEADRWRVSATRWRTVVVTVASVAAVVALALFSRRRLLPRRLQV